MTEYVTTFAMRDGRVPNLTEQLAWLRDTGAVSPLKITELRARLRDLGDGNFRPVIRADQGAVSMSIRPLDAPLHTNVVDAEPILDRRRQPVFKGPDLGWQNRQLSAIRSRGMQEGLLADDNGAVVAAIRSSLAVIRPGEVIVPTHPRTTHSVTRQAVLDDLRARKITVREQPAGLTLADLRSEETWTISAVYGVHRVTGWSEYGSVMPARELIGADRAGVPTAAEMEADRWARAERV